MAKATQVPLKKIYATLYKTFGPQDWWPAQTRFEVIVGAILTQNTNWRNVERALANLKAKKLLSARALYATPASQIALHIKPAGYFNIKAKRLKNFIRFFYEAYNGRMASMVKEEASVLRKKLLAVTGIGPETADSILLYACDKPAFVVDAYTRRFLYRHNLADHDADYHAIQNIFTATFDPDVTLYNEYHALIVRLGKEYCRPKPRCAECPLKRIHYSVQKKCRHCHRALQKGENYNRHGQDYFCACCPAK